MRLMSRIGLALLAAALLLPAGCRKATAPEPATNPVSLTGASGSPLGPQAPVSGSQPSTPATSAIPFTLQVDPPSLKLAAGASAKVKITAIRNDYQGAVVVELRNLPARVTAPRATLAAGAVSVEIEVAAAADAGPGSKADVQAEGMGTGPVTALVSSAPFTIDVRGTTPFSLKTQPASVKLAPGGRAKVKISTVRSGYQGPITVELRNLPSGVEAPKGVIPMDKSEVELELTAAASASVGTRKDVTALGATTASASLQVVSPNFTLDVQPASASAHDFTLRVEAVLVHVKQGGKAKVTVLADRGKGYQGPITVELHNLPGHVIASQGVIPQGKDRVSLDLVADHQAVPGDKPDVNARGQSSAGNNQPVSSPPFVVSVQAVGGHPATAHAGNPANHPKGPAAPGPKPSAKPSPKPRLP